MNKRDAAPCPTCGEYSDSLGEDRIAKAYNHFQAMIDHRGDGIPTQYAFDEETRDAAKVLMAAARSPFGEEYERFTNHLAKSLLEFGNIPEGKERPQNAITLWKAMVHGLQRVADRLTAPPQR